MYNESTEREPEKITGLNWRKRLKNVSFREIFPSIANLALAILSGILLIFAFPNYELFWLAWFGYAPFLLAICRESEKKKIRTFFLGWAAGTVFFFGTCYWLTYAPIRYAGFPVVLAYILLIPAVAGAGIFHGIFSLILAKIISKFGKTALLAAPSVWIAVELLRFYLTGNIWNALGYSQAFVPAFVAPASWGSVYAVGFLIMLVNAAIAFILTQKNLRTVLISSGLIAATALILVISQKSEPKSNDSPAAVAIALQPNVPMDMATYQEVYAMRDNQVRMAENALREAEQREDLKGVPRFVIFPESPMNYTYARDSEFREFLHDFTSRNKIKLLFNSAEPNRQGTGYHNSAVMVNEAGSRIAQYDKIYLMPFGEYIPLPDWLPGKDLLKTFVGTSTPGESIKLMSFNSTKAGVFICFESLFPNLTRQMTLDGADLLVELTNDGYLGPTAVLRQHLANAVFRSVETNRPLLRATNAGISARIGENGQVFDATKDYTEDTRIWKIYKSDGSNTVYVKYGDWFVWLSVILSLFLFVYAILKK
jgi:apolipoprotein N-acyltransferase